jgi:hypothetical protein
MGGTVIHSVSYTLMLGSCGSVIVGFLTNRISRIVGKFLVCLAGKQSL